MNLRSNDSGRTGANEGVGDENLLSLSAGHDSCAAVRRDRTAGTTGTARTATPCSYLTVGSGGRARVALLVLEKNGTDVIHGDVDGIGDTRDRQNTLQPLEMVEGDN
jgi:hypothetical protein